MSTSWIRFQQGDAIGFGQIEGELISVFRGNMFAAPLNTGEKLNRSDVTLLSPCHPGRFIGLWNNFHARAAHEGWDRPPHPLYFIKTENCYAGHGDMIRKPAGYSDAVVFEGELGIVIGKHCKAVSVANADDFIFGYTCVNDVTARGILRADPSFPQWCRAKSFDTFGPFGPQIVTGIEPDALTVTTLVNGIRAQHYPVTDMFFRPREIVAALSRDMTLYPGDLIACGTSLGAAQMNTGDSVDILIEGVGRLRNEFQ